MMRRLIVALIGLVAFCAPVAAQMSVIAPTASPDANNNQIANTAWVKDFLSRGSISAVSVLNFGAIAGDPTKFAQNQAAFQTALATGQPVYCPAGNVFYTQAITIPANAYSIYGGCALVAAGNYAAPPYAVLYGIGNANLTIRDITVNNGVITNVINGIQTVSNTNLLIDHVVVQAYNAISDTFSTGTVIRDSQVPLYANIGILSTSGTHTKILNNTVKTTQASSRDAGPPYYCIQANMADAAHPGSDVVISGNTTTNCGSAFGINVNGYDPVQYKGAIVSENKTYNTLVEGINIVGVDGFAVTGNYSEFDGLNSDQGIDTWGPHATLKATNGTFVGNTIKNACAGGISMIGWSENITVTGNTIVNANACQSAAGNANAAVTLWGAVKNSGVFGNTIIDPNGYIKWQVNEFNDGTGSPDFNTVSENAGPNGSLGRINLVGANSRLGESCVFKQGVGSCSATPPNSAVAFGSVTSNGPIAATASSNSLLFNSTVNTNAGASAGAVNIVTSNAGSASLQVNSTAGGGNAQLVSSLPFTLGSTGITYLGTASTVSIDAAGLLKNGCRKSSRSIMVRRRPDTRRSIRRAFCRVRHLAPVLRPLLASTSDQQVVFTSTAAYSALRHPALPRTLPAPLPASPPAM